jgi:prepilin-type N-terminal cleavage/methylation domain-containing protein/prepilin-type processing-associated H-X9-DG protein
MKNTTKFSQKAFTLIELLVVISIIALLLAILLPALGKAKSSAQRLICGNDLKQVSLGVRLYTEQNKGWVPAGLNSSGTASTGSWLWDISFWTTNEISALSGVDNKVFYCPGNPTKKATDGRFWQFTWLPAGANLTQELSIRDESSLTVAEQKDNYRVLSYVFMFDKYTYNAATNKYTSLLRPTWETGEPAKWIRRTTDLKNPSATILAMDAILTDGNNYNFDDVRGGSWTGYGVADITNHLSRQSVDANRPNKKPLGANVGYVDGHIVWSDFGSSVSGSSIKHRATTSNMWFWW